MLRAPNKELVIDTKNIEEMNAVKVKLEILYDVLKIKNVIRKKVKDHLIFLKKEAIVV